jgi:nicotinamidase/pyrazinamidase
MRMKVELAEALPIDSKQRDTVRYPQIVEGELIPVRSSAHVCNVLVHSDPRYWHSEGLNAFAKAERDLGRRDRFVITGELYRDLPEEAKQEFTDLAQSVTVGERSDVYEFSAGAPGDRNMDLKIHEMQLIKLESASFRAAVQPALQRREPSVLITQPILIVVDLQQDFAGDRALAVQDAEKIAELHYSLARDAISAGFEVVVTRDWHPADHFSFKKKWPEHCVAGGDGARFIPQFRFDDLQERALVVDIGATNETPDYSPYYHGKLQDFMENRAPEQILVSGIALEYCVLATCLSSLAYSSRVIALQDYIGSAKVDQAGVAWGLLRGVGVQMRKGNPFT